MSYQVLARKWRPTKFSELVGQEHVKSAIINGLTHQRTHHAYLFTGTRGVGKTTIARIFAKSLNCETGVSSEPCGTCSVCLDVDAGRFVDLIEIDAASRTKVGDTREILDNVQYAPTRGRYKIYLIDEVHMLSRHSFNALLKTLEEPPEHVKFLFATTDPQKLPVTILSRCLQFNLQALSVVQIATQLQNILNAENIPFEQSAIELLAKYARGSMRDGLSLTDQAIAQSGQNITLDIVQQMLGTVDQSWSLQIMQAVINQSSDDLVALFQRLQQQQPDFIKVLDDLITLTHQVAMCQLVPAAAQLSEENEAAITQFAKHLSPQQVQVYYQMLLQGKKELAYAVSPASGLEMTCLRLLAFSPAAPEQLKADTSEKKNADVVTPLSVVSKPVVDLETTEAADENKDAASGTELSSPSEPDKPQNESADVKVELEAPKVKPDSEPPVIDSDTVQTKPELSEADLEHQVPMSAEALDSNQVNNEQGSPVTEPKNASSEAVKPAREPQQNDTSSDAPPLDAYADYPMAEEDYDSIGTEYDSVNTSGNASSQSTSTGSADTGNVAVESAAVESVEAPVASHHDLPDEDNPVLAILAARGVNLAPGASSETNKTSQSNLESTSSTQAREANQAENQPYDTNQETTEPGQESIPSNESEAPAVGVVPEPELLPVESEEVRYAHQVDKWASMIEQSGLMGLGRQLALNSEVNINGDTIELVVRQEFAHLLNERSEQELTDVVSRMVPASEFIINKSAVTMTAPSDIQQNINLNRQERAEKSIEHDPTVQMLLNEFDAKVIPDSIKPL